MNNIFCICSHFKKIFIVLLLLITINLFAGETDDIQFILGLYSDSNYELAEVEIQKFLINYPVSNYIPQTKYLLANILFKSGDYKQAIPIYINLEKHLPKYSPNISALLIQSYYLLDDYESAEKRIKTFFKDSPNNNLAYQVYFYQGLINSKRGKFLAAIENFKKALKENYDSKIETELLLVYIKLDETEKIEHIIKSDKGKKNYDINLIHYFTYLLKEQRYEKLASLIPKDFPKNSLLLNDYNTILGIFYYKTKNYKKAIQILEETKGDRSKYYLALSFINTQKTEKAKTVFQKLVSSDNLEISGNSKLYLAEINSANNPKEAIKELSDFLKYNQNHSSLSLALYLLGYNYFKIEQYELSWKYLSRALKIGLDEPVAENATFLYSDALFMGKEFVKSKEVLLAYNEKYPNGKFIDESLYKLGIIDFEAGEINSSKNYFNTILDSYPNFTSLFMVYFYLGEIFWEQQDYTTAENRYLHSLELNEKNKHIINTRLASIHYLNGNYKLAEDYLNKVSEKSQNQFNKDIMLADIKFSQKRYTEALNLYEKAEKTANNSNKKQNVLEKKAQTYYQLKQYNKAYKLYKNLFNTYSQGNYLLELGKTAFVQDKFKLSIKHFNEYLDRFGVDNNYNDINFSIANGYYNLSDYKNSSYFYKNLIVENNPDYANFGDGFFWSAILDSSIDFVSEINNKIKITKNNEFLLYLISQKIRYFEHKQDINNVILSAGEYLKIEPNEIEIINTLSNAYLRLEKFDKAEAVFEGLDLVDSDILYNWAQLKLNSRDTLGAIEKLKEATENSKNSKIWLQYLSLLNKKNDRNFSLVYSNFISFAEKSLIEQADVFKIEFMINNDPTNNWIKTNINRLAESKYVQIKAYSQFFKGLLFYRLGNYKLAIPELLRTSYLFPKFKELKKRATYLVIDSYVKIENDTQAIRMLNTSKDILTADEINRFSLKLGIINE